ncbi:threonine/serine exporter family protein [Streptacidiphilus sp. PB12-B1b]|uniref:threonine/serine ThrE exporter family protein n=1 Tax=Streptacidiphilus sp. PB12-B1b TaxID=2705012 RepID=UPI001CDC099E|nr:threonine/serine exporter family protein [Streptacidiphilus sp. PB12-B1b]QMU74893.1 threonine/serine exporter family protein [Streptacidiphilus sp. PB12-B1b]
MPQGRRPGRRVRPQRAERDRPHPAPPAAPAPEPRPSGPRASGPRASEPRASEPRASEPPASVPPASPAPQPPGAPAPAGPALTVTPGLLGPETPDPTAPTAAPAPSAATAPPTPGADDWAAYGYTPPAGISLAQLRIGAPGDAPWPDRMRTLLRTPMSERPAFERSHAPEQAEVGRNVPRILDLTLRIGELLLASGESAEDVEAAMLGVTHAYGLDRCEPQVTFTLISISYQPSLTEPPVTSTRVVRRRGSDYTRLASVYRLVADITGEQASVEDAYRRLAAIRRNRHPYPGWLLSLATGLLAGAATLLVGGVADPKAMLVFVSAFFAATLGDRLAWAVAHKGLPEFYQFVVAAMPAAALGVVLTLGESGLRGSVLITGGLYALLPGRALVAAVADGLTGFYITAAARLLEVLYLVVGIILGVLLVLYVGVKFGADLHPEQSLATHPFPALQLPAAMALTLFFAVLLQTSRRVLPMVTLLGGVGWSVYGVLTVQGHVSPILATGVAAGMVGLFGQLASRYRYASSLPYVTAALGPLLPGSAIYLGLLSLARGEPLTGLLAVSRAAALALALAVGVNLGGEVARLFLKVPQGTGPTVVRSAAKRTRGF